MAQRKYQVKHFILFLHFIFSVGRSENELQKLMFSRVGRSAPRIFEAAIENREYIMLPMFLLRMTKIKRQDEENENELQRLMYSRW